MAFEAIFDDLDGYWNAAEAAANLTTGPSFTLVALGGASLSPTSESNALVSYSITDASSTVFDNGLPFDNNVIVPKDVRDLDDGTITLSVTLTDDAGNPTTASNNDVLVKGILAVHTPLQLSDSQTRLPHRQMPRLTSSSTILQMHRARAARPLR